MVLAIALLGGLSQSAWAACTSPPGVEGQFQYITTDYKWCDGTSWQSMSVGAPGAVCAVQGMMTYNSNDMLFCNGGNWISMNGTSSSGSCAGFNIGTFRYNSSAKKMEWCDSTNWKYMQLTGSSMPDSFNFADQSNVAAATLIASNIVQITGLSADAGVSITGAGSPQFRVCPSADCSTGASAWGSASGTISNNQYLQIRATSSASSGTINTPTVTVGGGFDSWIVSTTGPMGYFVLSASTTSGNMGGYPAGTNASW